MVRSYKGIALNSSPRYEDVSWGFYDGLGGCRKVGVAEKLRGEGGDAVVWQRIL